MVAEVETRYGRIAGTTIAGVHTFHAIPFAAPLVGTRRFRPPEPPIPWAGTRDATTPGPAAPQLSMPVFSWINMAGGRLGDDCLSLNVWTPGRDGAHRPVLVWIHGGGFLVGAGTTPIYDGHDLALRGDVVVVTLNYRLGALGYCHLGTLFGEGFEHSTNLGVRDQIAALEWIHEHIDRFGGDPGNITVFGQSAGGMSTAALLGAPRARELIRRAICMSGAADQVVDRETARRVAADFIGRLGGPGPSHSNLARIPLEEILQAQSETMMAMVDARDIMVFLPMVGDDVIPEPPLEALRRGAAAHIPIMTGATLEEWKLFRLLDQGIGSLGWDDVADKFAEVLADDRSAAPEPERAVTAFRGALGTRSAAGRPSDVWSAFQTSRLFHWPSIRLAEAQHAGGGPVYSYLFTWRAPAMRRALGSCHSLDIPFVFGSTGHPFARPFTGLTAAATRLSRKIQHAWLCFARSGEPADERLPAWSGYEPERRATMILGRDCTLSDAPLDAERQLLEQWLGAPHEISAQATPSAARR